MMATIKREKFIAIQAKGGDVENGKDVVDNVIDSVVEKLSERQLVIYNYCDSLSGMSRHTQKRKADVPTIVRHLPFSLTLYTEYLFYQLIHTTFLGVIASLL